MIKHLVKIVSFRESLGISLLEAVFTLLIIAAMILATVVYFRQAEHQTQITALLSEMKGVIEAAEDYNDAQGSFKGITVRDIASANKIVPRYNVVIKDEKNGEYLMDPWTGLGAPDSSAVGIAVSAAPGNDNLLLVTLNQLPSFACEQVLEQLTQFMDIYTPYTNTQGRNIRSFCVYANTQDALTTLGEPYSFTYPKGQ